MQKLGVHIKAALAVYGNCSLIYHAGIVKRSVHQQQAETLQIQY